MFGKLVEAGIGLAIKAPLLKLLGCRSTSPVLKALQHYWSGHPEILGEGFQDAFEQAMLALAWGLAPDTFWKKQAGRLKANVTKEFATNVVSPIFNSFCQGRTPEEKLQLRELASRCCEIAALQKATLFPLGDFTEIQMANLLNEQTKSEELGQQLFGRLAQLDEWKRAPAVVQLLQHDQLLLRSVFQFFREVLLRDSEVQKRLQQLQQEGIRTDIRLTQSAQDESRQLLEARLGTMDQRLAALGQQHQEAIASARYDLLSEIGSQMGIAGTERQHLHEHLAQFANAFQAAQQEWGAFGGKLDEQQQAFRQWSEACSGQLNELRSGLGQLHEFLQLELTTLVHVVEGGFNELKGEMAQIKELLINLQGGIQLSASSFHSVINTRDVQKIQAAEVRLSTLPVEDERYCDLANTLGSALASMGSVKKAEQCFQKAAKSARQNHQTKAEGLAHYNLFQVYIQQGAHQQALEHLTKAVKLDHESYLPFPMDDYTPLKILGAGGMGCAFLCEKAFSQEKVVVKVFWNTEGGTHKEVFQEAFMMNHVDKEGEFVPRVLSAGYVNALKRERPYLVMEFVENSIDGESYLKQRGKMSWSEGLAIGLKVARALQKAHEREVCHLDLKPANLLFCQGDNGIEVKIIDFGLARAARSLREEIVQRSRSGMTVMAQQIFGTIDYAPPEQLGHLEYGDPGFYSDIYSFAATLYRLLTCDTPKVINPHKLPDTPHGFYDLLCYCMMPDPKQRPASAAVVVAKLEQLKTPSRHPLVEKTLAQALDDHILEDSEEAMLWNIVQYAGYDQDYMMKMVEDELQATQSRRMSAIWAEQWLQEQTPARYHIDDVWGAVAQSHSHIYHSKGGGQTPWLTPIDHLRPDPAFVFDEPELWLRVWEPLLGKKPIISETTEGDTSIPPGSGEIIKDPIDDPAVPEANVGRFVREIGIKHLVWVRVLHPDTGKPVADETELHLLRQHIPKVKTLTFSGQHKVKKVRELFHDAFGLKVDILDANGEPADPGSRMASHRLIQGRWAMTMGSHLFLYLQPPDSKGDCAWRDFGTVRFGGVAKDLILVKETIPITLHTERGEFAATLAGEKNRFRNFGDFFAAYPELRIGDIVCLTSVEEDVFEVEIFCQDDPTPEPTPSGTHTTVSEPTSSPTPTLVEPVQPVSTPTEAGAGSEPVVAIIETDAPQKPATTTTNEPVQGAESVVSVAVDGSSTSEGQGCPDGGEGDGRNGGQKKGASPGAEPEPAPVPIPEPMPIEPGGVGVEKVSVDLFVKEFAMEHRVWLQILDPADEKPLPLTAFVDDYRTHPPRPDDLSLHGGSHVKTADAQIEKVLGLKVQILAPSGEPAKPDTTLGRYWLRGGAHLLSMGKSIFFTLKPPTRSGILSWRKNGYLKFGKRGLMLFPKQENIDIVIYDDEREYKASLECRNNQFGKLRELFRENPDLEPGDIVCLTRETETRFKVDFFVGSGDAEVDEEDEDAEEAEEAAEAMEAQQASHTALPSATSAEDTAAETEAQREARFRTLITTSNAALAEGRLDAAWEGYNELHFHFPILLETDLDAYRRVAAARFFQEGLEMIEDDPGFALRKLEGAHALDATLLPLQVKQYIEELREKQRELRKKRFIRLCKKGCQIAPTDPEEALQLFEQAKNLAPHYWTSQLDRWVLYAQQVLAHQRQH